MSIRLVSISHKTAPLEVRELFAFTKEQQEELMRTLISEGRAAESVVISTCNRTEIYTYYEDQDGQRKNLFTLQQQLILRAAGAENSPNVADYLRFYQDEKAVCHLFSVAAGLDSMVVGEDQILGQVKKAQEQAQAAGTSGKYLNTLFRYAITCSKKNQDGNRSFQDCSFHSHAGGEGGGRGSGGPLWKACDGHRRHGTDRRHCAEESLQYEGAFTGRLL